MNGYMQMNYGGGGAQSQPFGCYRDRDEFERNSAKRYRSLDEGKRLRFQTLSNAGVDLSLFSEDRARNDAAFFIGRTIPEDYFWVQSVMSAIVTLDPKNLTKAGKVPKNVLEAGINGIDDQTDGGVIGSIKYLADGRINMMDYHLWRNHIKHTFSIRVVQGMFRITFVEVYDLQRDFRNLLYSNKEPADCAEQIDLLKRSMGYRY